MGAPPGEDYFAGTFTGGSQNGDQENGHRTLEVRRASTITMEATQWLWQDNDLHWMPLGEFTLLGGREGIGKSTMAYHIAAQITQGSLTGDFYGTPKAVIICATEDSWSKTITPRLKAVGANMDLIFQVNAITPEGFPVNVKLPADIHEIEQIVTDYDVALIILDPLMSAIDSKLDTHKDASVRLALEPLIGLAMRANAAIVGLIHQKKGAADDLRAKLMASIAFVAVARNVLYCGHRREEDNPRHTFWFGQIKTNLGPKAMQTWIYYIEGVPNVGWDKNKDMPVHSSRIVMDELIEGNVEDLYVDQEKEAAKAKKNTAGNQVQRWLTHHIGNRSLRRTAVLHEALDEMGFSESTVKRAFREMGGESSPIPGTQNEKYWRLPHEA